MVYWVCDERLTHRRFPLAQIPSFATTRVIVFLVLRRRASSQTKGALSRPRRRLPETRSPLRTTLLGTAHVAVPTIEV
jgi:hypothetical protein